MVCGIITIVANNGMYGTIRMHQEREYPRRVVGTTLINPDFAAYARSFGADGYSIETAADFAPAFKSALNSKPTGGDRTQARPRGDQPAPDPDGAARARLRGRRRRIC
jgi:hypothetical protein